MRKRQSGINQAARHEYAYLYAGHPIKWVWNLIRPVRSRFLVGLLLDLGFIVAGLVPAIIAGRIIDKIYIGHQLQLLLPSIILLISVPFSRACAQLGSRYFFESCSQTTIMNLRENLYEHLQNLNANFYGTTSTGDIMAKMTGDIDMVRHFVAYTGYASIESLLLFTIGTIYMFTLSWQLSLASLLISPAILLITYRLGRTVRPIWQEIREIFTRLNAVVQQNIAGNKIIRAFNRAEFEEQKFEQENDAFRNANIRQAKTAVGFLSALDALGGLLGALVVLVGGYLVIRGQFTVGGIVTFSSMLFVLSRPMSTAGQLMNEFQRFNTSANKILDLMLEHPRIMSPAKLSSQSGRLSLRGKIEFRNVTFSYGEKGGQVMKPTLQNINLVALPGQTIGIIGLTGAGKTTLINLIARIYDTTSGVVLLDDLDIRDYNLQDLRRNIGMVMQDVFLFSDTVEGNIAYGVPEAPLDLVQQSAGMAEAHDFIVQLTDGYETIIGERGVGLSGGQRQRIALARALAMEPKILILDDTTSSVDMETEQLIQEALHKHKNDWTVFIIAHRISSVRHADKIIVLDQGRIIEQGTHDELVARQGIYRDIFLTQAGLDSERTASETTGCPTDDPAGREGGEAPGTQSL